MSRLINRNIKLRLAFSTEESGLFEGRKRRTGFEGKIAKKKNLKGSFFFFNLRSWILLYFTFIHTRVNIQYIYNAKSLRLIFDRFSLKNLSVHYYKFMIWKRKALQRPKLIRIFYLHFFNGVIFSLIAVNYYY